jgi:hypothetical protein
MVTLRDNFIIMKHQNANNKVFIPNALVTSESLNTPAKILKNKASLS